MTAFAVYRDREVACTYFNGAWYVKRHDQYPHTLGWVNGHAVIVQGHSMLVGIRQGNDDSAGFTVRHYRRPDTLPYREFRDGPPRVTNGLPLEMAS